MPTQYLKVKDVAEILKCHPSTVVCLIEQGRIPADRIGAGFKRNHYRIPADFEVAPPQPIRKKPRLVADLNPALLRRMSDD